MARTRSASSPRSSRRPCSAASCRWARRSWRRSGSSPTTCTGATGLDAPAFRLASLHMFRVLALVGALTLLLAAPASAFTKKAMTFNVTTGPDGKSPCKVSADLYTPAGVSKANPAPAVMGTNGFGGSKADFTTLASAYAERGYIFLAYSGLGFGGSGCKIELDDPDWDGKAGSQLVSYLGGKSGIAFTDAKHTHAAPAVDFVVKDAVAHDGSARAFDPRVGMIGG